jgi:murein DD-endopeptidase MepM/ murein hydrolase activator NlpD
MPKSKYKFDPESLQYDNVDPKGRKRIVRLLITQIISAIVFSVVFYFAFIYFFGTPDEKNLKRENEFLEEQYKILSERYQQTEIVLKDLKQRDDNIYRAIFEAEPPQEDSVLKISDFENFDDLALVKDNNTILDSLKIILFAQDETFTEVKEMLVDKKDELQNIPSIQPLPNADLKFVPYGYGKRIDPVYKTPSFHYGIDFAAPKGTEVYATADGKVTRADEKVRGYGNHIRIDHGNGYETVYAHLSDYMVYVGQSVSKGDIIGFVGNTGKSLVTHLHYEVIYEDDQVNPVNFFFQDLNPSQYNQLVEAASRSGLSLD